MNIFIISDLHNLSHLRNQRRFGFGENCKGGFVTGKEYHKLIQNMINYCVFMSPFV